MKPGRSLEKLVHTLERALATNACAKIESPGRLIDIHTGKKREHDVLITLTEGIHTVVIAIECRDRSRPFGVPHLEGFRQKCLDTGVSKGVVVSSQGFRKSALKKANVYSIPCISLSQADSFDWLALPMFAVFDQNLVHLELELLIDTPSIEAVNDASLLFRTVAGQFVSPDAVRERLRRYIIGNAYPVKAEGNFKMPFTLTTDGLFVVVESTGETFPVRAFRGAAYFTVKRHESEFQLMRYGSQEVAIAPVEIGALQGNFVVVMGSEEGKAVFVSTREKLHDLFNLTIYARPFS